MAPCRPRPGKPPTSLRPGCPIPPSAPCPGRYGSIRHTLPSRQGCGGWEVPGRGVHDCGPCFGPPPGTPGTNSPGRARPKMPSVLVDPGAPSCAPCGVSPGVVRIVYNDLDDRKFRAAGGHWRTPGVQFAHAHHLYTKCMPSVHQFPPAARNLRSSTSLHTFSGLGCTGEAPNTGHNGSNYNQNCVRYALATALVPGLLPPLGT
jgi:hypothetical protein